MFKKQTKNCVGLKVKKKLTNNVHIILYYNLKLHTQHIIFYNSYLIIL